MKLRNFKQIGTAAILTAVLALNSCQKEEAIAPKTNNTVKSPVDLTASTFGKVDRVQSDIMMLAQALTNGTFGKQEGILSCATVTRDDISMPHHAVIDFGTGCTDGDGIVRSGVVEVYYNFDSSPELRNNLNSQIAVTFSNFVNGDVSYDGTATLLNAGPDSDNYQEFRIDVNMTVNDLVASETVSMVGNNSFKFTRGFETQTSEDDALSVTGSLSGSTNGEAYTATVTPSNPLVRYRSQGCDEYYVQGEMVYNYAGGTVESIDYGMGECDNLAIKTTNGSPQTITLD